MKSKKGISDVVTTVLIILLALAAVIIIWSFIRPAIQGAGEGVQSGVDCFNTNVEVVSCTGTTVVVRNNGEESVTIRIADDEGNTPVDVGPVVSLATDNSATGVGGAGINVTAAAVLTDGTVCAPVESVTCA